jgi:hypothetical protein
VAAGLFLVFFDGGQLLIGRLIWQAINVLDTPAGRRLTGAR